MDGTEFLNLAIRTPIPDIGSHYEVVDSYRLEENDMIFPIHTLNINERSANYGTSIDTGCET